MLIDVLRTLAAGRDTFIRHLCISSLLRRLDARTVLDVGGEGCMNIFAGQAKVTTVNIRSGRGVDHVIAGDRLPFAEGSFDAVISVDTLEHLAKGDRPGFIQEMARVAGKGVILCAPLGTPEHIKYEKHLLANGKLPESDAEYLKEHIDNGLPTPQEVDELAKLYSGKLFFQGDFRGLGKAPRGRLRSLSGNIFANLGLVIFWGNGKLFEYEFTPYTNRFFLVVEKQLPKAAN